MPTATVRTTGEVACAAACTASFSSRSGAARDASPLTTAFAASALPSGPAASAELSPASQKNPHNKPQSRQTMHISDRPDFTDRLAFFVRFMTCSLLC